MNPRRLLAAALAGAVLLSGCSIGGDEDGANGEPTTVQRTTRVEVVRDAPSANAVRFDPAAVYERVGPGVVTVFSVFGRSGGANDRPEEGVGSGFVISENGEIVSNAHVVTEGEGRDLKRAEDVYVQFADGNQVPARIVGVDPNADIALLRVQRGGLTLRPLSFGASREVRVGAPVAAIGSPYGEPQSLSVGIISGIDRTIDSLTGFTISGAIQTDAAINRGNSGGPLVDARGRVLGVNSQIRSTGGGGEGVGFAVPVDMVRRSVSALRRSGKVEYAYLGIETAPVYPQLSKRFELGTDTGAWVQAVNDGGPADDGGLRGGDDRARFQASTYRTGGDVIVELAGRPIRDPDDLGQALQRVAPGDEVPVVVVRDGERQTVTITVGKRPAQTR
ncbi:MAG: trypsin-like peptidase domain-containing protein [Solirubrobacteraceae bacterium]|nr:trypsin-like peptidase domain-containing protein [Solirubrobacteraceae bacterium]